MQSQYLFRRTAFTVVELLVVVIAIIAVLIGMLVSAVQKVRYAIDPVVFQKLGNKSDGQVIDKSDF